MVAYSHQKTNTLFKIVFAGICRIFSGFKLYSPTSRDGPTIKLFEYVGVIVVLGTIFPVLIIVAAQILLDGGSLLVVEPCVRADGTRYDLWRFRTTGVGRQSATPTAFGRLLKLYSLDELPRLFSVLAGTTTLIDLAKRPIRHQADQRKP